MRPAEVVRAAGQRAGGRVIARADQFVAELEGVLARILVKLSWMVNVLADVLEARQSGQPVADVEIREGRIVDVGDAELFRPVPDPCVSAVSKRARRL